MVVAVVATRPRPPRSWPVPPRVLRDVGGWVVVVLVLLVWAVTLRPTQLGGPATYVVVSGDSMEPTLSDGDLVVLRHRDGYAVGDVISYPVPAGGPGAGSLVIHRVVAGDGDGLTTQGDNRDRSDDWRPTAEAVRGSLWWHVPGGGLLLVRLLQPPMVAALAGGAFTTWILLRRPAPGRPPGTQRKRFFARHVSGRIDPALTGRDARSSGRVQGPARTGSARPAGLEQGPGRQARGTPARAGHRG